MTKCVHFAIPLALLAAPGGVVGRADVRVPLPEPQVSPSPVGPAAPLWVATPEPEPSPRHRITRLPVCIRGIDENRYPPFPGMLTPEPPTEDDDPDKDGARTAWDNCPATWNPDQKDSNEDGLGDVCTDPDERHPIVCIATPVFATQDTSVTGPNRVFAFLGARADARQGAVIVELKYFADGRLTRTTKPTPVSWLGKGVVQSEFAWTAPPSGRHLLEVVAVTADGFEARSEPVVLVVKERY